MLVRELMTDSVVEVTPDTTVRSAVKTMLGEGIGSVLVVEESVPVGIFTGTDALVVAYECDCPFSEIEVATGMTEDLVTGTPDMTVREAAKRLTEAGIEKLPIVQDMEVAGILTLNDIVREHTSLIKEAYGLDVRRRKWTFDEDDD
jgi:CBS domain-containing protein